MQLLRRTGRVSESVPLYERALALFEKTAGPAHRTTTTCMLALAAIREERGDVPGAAELYGRAAQALRQAVADEPKKSPALAAILVRLGARPRARAAPRPARVRPAHPPAPLPRAAPAPAGEAHASAGRLGDAEGALAEAVGICAQRWGAASPRGVQPRLLLAELLLRRGQPERARAEATAALGCSPAEGQRERLEGVLARCG